MIRVEEVQKFVVNALLEKEQSYIASKGVEAMKLENSQQPLLPYNWSWRMANSSRPDVRRGTIFPHLFNTILPANVSTMCVVAVLSVVEVIDVIGLKLDLIFVLLGQVRFMIFPSRVYFSGKFFGKGWNDSGSNKPQLMIKEKSPTDKIL